MNSELWLPFGIAVVVLLVMLTYLATKILGELMDIRSALESVEAEISNLSPQ